jgi:hypothetical protein
MKTGSNVEWSFLPPLDAEHIGTGTLTISNAETKMGHISDYVIMNEGNDYFFIVEGETYKFLRFQWKTLGFPIEFVLEKSDKSQLLFQEQR